MYKSISICNIMRVQVLSDIHLEEKLEIPVIIPTCDTLFLAGDIGVLGHHLYETFIDYCSRGWDTIFYVLGNHEFYSTTKSIDELINDYKNFFGKYNNIVLLDNSKCQFGGFQIIGCTFWGDFKGDKHISGSPKKIQVRENGCLVSIGGDGLTAKNVMSQKWILDHIHPVLPTIILTHFPLTLENDKVRQVRYRSEDKKVLQEYGTEMCLTTTNKVVCISGHTHFSHDFNKNGVRYISNQLGDNYEVKKRLCDYKESSYNL